MKSARWKKIPSRAQASAGPAHADIPPPPEDPSSLHGQIVATYGPPFRLTDKDEIKDINQNYYAARFVHEHKLVFDQKEGRFYTYNEDRGDWKRGAQDYIKKNVREDWFRISKDFKRHDQLSSKLTDATLNSIVNNVRSLVGAEDIFKRLQAKERYHGLLHVTNGMLTIRPDGSTEIAPFSSEYYSRNVFDFVYDSKAECPQFNAVLKHAFAADNEQEMQEEISLFRRLCGGFLIQGNPAHKIPLMIGEACASKSMLMTIIESIVGKRNTSTLRTHLLHERFELARFSGKILLTAKDVPGDFLQHEGAQALKSLCGGDAQVAEFKGSMEQIEISGDYHVGITSNERLLVRMNRSWDAAAWARRLVLFNFNHPVERIIPDYHLRLLREEGAGIFALFVRGASEYLRDLQEHGKVVMNEKQQERVDSLIYESQSLALFMQSEMTKDEISDVSSQEVVDSYTSFCAARGWVPLTFKTIERRLPELMHAFFGAHKSNHVERNGSRVNGYPGVFLRDSKK